MSLTAVLAAATTAIALLCWRPPASWVLRTRLSPPGVDLPVRLPDPRAWSVPRARWLVAAGVALAPWLVTSPVSALLCATACGAGAFALVLVGRVQRRGRRDALASRVTAGVDLLSAELRGGSTPTAALASVGAEVPDLAAAARVAREGGDVIAALTSAAATPGAEQLSGVAAAWQVAERSGAPIAVVLGRMADHARDEAAIAQEIRTESAPARATGRVMALLPVAGLGLGSGLGGDPLRVITQTLPGALCLAVGTAFACAGLWWIEQIADRAEDER